MTPTALVLATLLTALGMVARAFGFPRVRRR